ncbi:MAG: DUF58 domain-containing protein [Deltaproteobacteria bacterium]|nr:DUF58 domain-containing protein [Deltaproteobacteria bacterium]
MSAQVRATPATPVWISIPGIFLHGFGIFLLPFAVGLTAAIFLEVSEVAETFVPLTAFFAALIFPISLAQLLGLILKVRRDVRYWRERRQLGPRRLLHILHDHLRVITLRGWTVLVVGLGFIALSLSLKWASFGLMAALALFLFYLITGWTVFVSTFLVRTFEVGLERRKTGIRRQILPAVCAQGDVAEEVFTFNRVPVPWGYLLVVEDPLPARLQTESRYVLGKGGQREVEARGRLRATPRGLFHLGPARLWYQDILGVTRVSVASVATAELKVLPRLKEVVVVEPPRTPQQAPDVITRPHRFATEDHFRFRDYAQGDDTRRIHWRLSLKTGTLQVRQPETREIATKDVVLVLDSYLPKGKMLNAAHGADDILDALVDAWLGTARTLIERGDKVTLVAALQDHEGAIHVERLAARKGQSARWQDMGARALWQGQYDLAETLQEVGDTVHGVVVTARFTAPAPELQAGQTLTWLFMHPRDALGASEPHWVGQIIGSDWRALLWPFILPHPAGSEDNAIPRRLADLWHRWSLYEARQTLRRAARYRADHTLQQLLTRGDAVYRLERTPRAIRLVGLQGQRRRG